MFQQLPNLIATNIWLLELPFWVTSKLIFKLWANSFLNYEWSKFLSALLCPCLLMKRHNNSAIEYLLLHKKHLTELHKRLNTNYYTLYLVVTLKKLSRVGVPPSTPLCCQPHGVGGVRGEKTSPNPAQFFLKSLLSRVNIHLVVKWTTYDN